MKKNKVLIGMFIIFVMMFNIFATAVYAEDTREFEAPDENVEYEDLYGIASNKFEFSPLQMLIIYSLNSSTPNESEFLYNKVLKYRHDINEGTIIPIRTYNGADNQANETEKLLRESNAWNDERIDGSDASVFLTLSVGGEVTTREKKAEQEEGWIYHTNILQYSLADQLNIPRNEVVINIDVSMDKLEQFGVEANEYQTNNVDRFTDEVLAKMLEFEQANHTIDVFVGKESANWVHQVLTVTATTENSGEWKLVLGTDNNFYWLKTKDPVIQEFKTTLEYETSEKDVKGKMEGNTFLPPYVDNDNTKKDLDVIATIKSKTKEEIKSTNDVELRNDEKPNSEGWYYPDVEDKTVIAKVYKFDEYDKSANKGIVNETVKLIGSQGGEDTQKPSIKWTFRRKEKTEKENKDGSVTVTITYNLPVDPESIPEGWSPIYDKDGKTIHSIEITIKKGEDYDKDVTVKQDGTDATVTTPVSKKWQKDNSQADGVIPQTGAFTILLAIVIVGATVFAITRYRKLNK